MTGNKCLRIIACLLLGVIALTMLYSCTAAEALADKKNYTETSDEYRRKFSFQLDSGEKAIRYGYHYVVSTVPNGYRVRVFHPDMKTMTEDKHYSTEALTLLHGEFKSWWDDGSIREQGFYQYGRKHGIWLEKEPGQGKSSSGEYFNQRKEGLWTQLDTNGMVESVFTWHDDKLHGKFFLYNSAGEQTNEGIYKNDTLISSLFPLPKVSKPYLEKCDDPAIPDIEACTDLMLTQYIYSELDYPAKARRENIEGSAYTQWDVGADGTVRNIRVPQSLSNEIKEEILQTLQRMPDWEAGTRNGVPVEMTVTLPINFRL